jgi:hypothetical protein
MRQWRIKSSTLAILSCVFVFMLLIVILPDVDLPDTAFHGGTAPVLVHASGTTALVSVNVPTLFQFSQPSQPSQASRPLSIETSSSSPNFLPILFRSIRC